MAGNRCGSCGQELESDNLLRIHLYRNDTCRDTLLERLESRAVEALAEALAEVRNSPHDSDSESVPGSPHSADSLFRYLREFPEHADFVRGYVSTSDDGSVSTVGDLFNTLNELYLFFKDADLSDREINRVLHIFNHPGYDPAAVRRWQNVADVRRFGEEHAPDDMVPWLKAEIEVRGLGGRCQMLELLYKDTKLEAYRIVMGPLMRENRDRKFGVKGETRSVLVRIPGGSTFFRSRANYAAFEYRGMMQVFPIVISDLCVGRSAEEREQRDKEVRAFRYYAVFYKSLLAAVRSMKPALTRTSKAMCLMTADDPLRMLYRETVGSEFDNMATLMAAEGLQTSRVLVHTAVAIPSTKGGYLVPKAMFVKASPKENWFTDIAIPGEREEEEEEEEWWYARCLCIFRAVNYSGEEGAYVFVKYYEEEGVCPQTLCPQLVPGRKEATHGIIEVASIQRIIHVCKSFTNPRARLLNSRHPRDPIDILPASLWHRVFRCLLLPPGSSHPDTPLARSRRKTPWYLTATMQPPAGRNLPVKLVDPDFTAVGQHRKNAKSYSSGWALLCCAMASKRLLTHVLSFSAHHPISLVYNDLHPQWVKSVAFFLRRRGLRSLALTYTHIMQLNTLDS
ncbi:unnamed protein product [Closterium sp. NIES-64]|nr:unnamed protein product [Closterium sp. NIES-64]